MPKFLEVTDKGAARSALGLPTVYHASDTIVADGVTDVSVTLGSLISDLPSNSVLQLGAGDYYAPTLRNVNRSGSLVIRGVPGKTRVLGNGALTAANRNSDILINILNGSLRVEDVEFQDQGVVFGFTDLSELGDIELYGCVFRDCGSPLMARFDPATVTTRIGQGITMAFNDLRIQRCQFLSCELGVWLQIDGGWNSVSITDNVFDDVGQAGVWVGFEYTPATGTGSVTTLDRTSWQPRQGRVVIHGNTFTNIRLSDYVISNPGANAVVVDGGQQVTVSNNHIENVDNDSVWDDCEGIYTKARYVSVHDNVLVNAGGAEAAIMCKGSDWEASTTIASGSNGQTLPQSTINVVSTEGFGPPFGAYASGGAGTFLIQTSLGWQSVTFTSKNATQLLGCSGGTGTLATGQAVRGNANQFNGLTGVSTPNSIHHNIVVFTRDDVSQRGIMNSVGNCTVSDNLIVGATGTAINVYSTTRVMNNVIRDHHGANGIAVGGPNSGGGAVVRGNQIINMDGSYVTSGPLIGISVATSSGTEYRDILISENMIRNELTASGTQSSSSANLRAVNINANNGTINGLTIRGNKARNVQYGINVSAVGTVSNFRDIDNDWSNEAGAAPITTVTHATNRSFRSMEIRTQLTLTTSATLGSTGDYLVLLNTGASPTLPTAVGSTSVYTLKNLTAGVITVLTTSSQTIEGNNSFALQAGASITVVSDNSNWRIL